MFKFSEHAKVQPIFVTKDIAFCPGRHSMSFMAEGFYLILWTTLIEFIKNNCSWVEEANIFKSQVRSINQDHVEITPQQRPQQAVLQRTKSFLHQMTNLADNYSQLCRAEFLRRKRDFHEHRRRQNTPIYRQNLSKLLVSENQAIRKTTKTEKN